MDARLLQRIMRLTEQTGDRMIVINPESGKAHAVLPFAAYEKIVKSTVRLRDLNEEYDQDDLSDYDDDVCSLCDEAGFNLDELTDEEDEINSDEKPVPTGWEAAKEAGKDAAEEKISQLGGNMNVDDVNQKLFEESQKLSETPIPMDVLDENEKDDEYYLEPIE